MFCTFTLLWFEYVRYCSLCNFDNAGRYQMPGILDQRGLRVQIRTHHLGDVAAHFTCDASETQISNGTKRYSDSIRCTTWWLMIVPSAKNSGGSGESEKRYQPNDEQQEQDNKRLDTFVYDASIAKCGGQCGTLIKQLWVALSTLKAAHALLGLIRNCISMKSGQIIIFQGL